jgi:phospholipase/carboxylesterase
MADHLLDTLELNPPGPARASVIWLHGLGADAHDFEGIVPELKLSPSLAVRFVFPNAPMRPVTLNAGMVMRAWYDVKGLELDQRQDEEGIRESQGALAALLRRQKEAGIPTDKMILAGFSQGGAIALQTGLRYPEALGGILALSCFLPLASTLAKEASPANSNIPIFLGHGTADSLIPIRLAQESRQLLESSGYRCEWHEYPMEHAVCPEEIGDIARWLERVLRSPSPQE